MTDPRKIILRMLCKTSDNFTETELGQVHFCGSFASCMKAEIEFACVHDIDILVDGPNMAARFWDFLDSLLEQGLRSFNNSEHPKSVRNWKTCNEGNFLHPTLLTLNCSLIGHKEQQLDIFIADAALGIPYLEKWMWDGGRKVEPFATSEHRRSFLKNLPLNQISFSTALRKVKDFLDSQREESLWIR